MLDGAAGPSAMWFEWGIRFFGKGRVRFFSVGCAVGASGIGMDGAYEGVENRMFCCVWAESGSCPAVAGLTDTDALGSERVIQGGPLAWFGGSMRR